MSGFHPLAWLAWCVAALAVVLSTTSPLVHLPVLGVCALVSATFASERDARAFRLMLRIGVVLAITRVVLFGLTGHTGTTTVVTLPHVRVPVWLGGFSLGGRVTGEVLAQSLAEGLRIVVVLGCLGVLLSVLPPHRMLRLVPAVLFEAGLVVAIAVTFVPTLVHAAGQIRDAQRTRGHRFRGVRSLRALVVPVLATALERSLTLAEALETRGFGRRLRGGGPARAHARRTRLRPDPARGEDRALFAACVGLIVGAVSSADAAGWSAYPTVSWPALPFATTLVALGLAAPVVVARASAARGARAERRVPGMAPGMRAPDAPARVAAEGADLR